MILGSGLRKLFNTVAFRGLRSKIHAPRVDREQERPMEGQEISSAVAVIDNGKFGKREIRFETGRLARQAAGAAAVAVAVFT